MFISDIHTLSAAFPVRLILPLLQMDFVVLLRIVAFGHAWLNALFSFRIPGVTIQAHTAPAPCLANAESQLTRMIAEGWLAIWAVDMAGFPHPIIASPDHVFASQLFTRGLLVNCHRGLLF